MLLGVGDVDHVVLTTIWLEVLGDLQRLDDLHRTGPHGALGPSLDLTDHLVKVHTDVGGAGGAERLHNLGDAAGILALRPIHGAVGAGVGAGDVARLLFFGLADGQEYS